MIKKPSKRVYPRTIKILTALMNEARRAAESGSIDRGFRTRLAKEYGVTRGRISNVAREYGLADQARSTRAKEFKARLRARHKLEAGGGSR